MIHDIFFKDFGWKLFSLLLAAFIWYTVQRIIGEPKAAAVPAAYTPVIYGEVPVAVMSAGKDARLFSLNSNTVTVNVSGPPEQMGVLEANQIHALVDVSDFDPASKDLFRLVEVTVPWGVTVVSVAPARLRIIPPAK
jgi:hypothetical protein